MRTNSLKDFDVNSIRHYVRDSMELCQAIYKSNTKEFLEKRSLKHSIKEILVCPELDDGLRFIIAKSASLNTSYLAIRGKFSMEAWTQYLQKNQEEEKSKCGFNEFLKNIPFAFLENQTNIGRNVVITGHSTGGIVAALATLELFTRRREIEHIFCITFGSPYFGDMEMKLALKRNELERQFYHIISMEDQVPKLMESRSEIRTISRELWLYLFEADKEKVGDLVRKVSKAGYPDFVQIGRYKFIAEDESRKNKVLSSHAILETNHSIESYKYHLQLENYFEKLSHFQVDNIIEINTDITCFPESRVGIISHEDKFIVLHVHIFGTGLEFSNILTEKDFHITPMSDGQKHAMKVIKLVHTSTHLKYNVYFKKVKNGGKELCLLELSISMSDIKGKQHKFDFQIEKAYFLTRTEIVNSSSIADLLLFVRQSLYTISWCKSSNREKNNFYSILHGLDLWLKKAILTLTDQQQKDLKKIMHYINEDFEIETDREKMLVLVSNFICNLKKECSTNKDKCCRLSNNLSIETLPSFECIAQYGLVMENFQIPHSLLFQLEVLLCVAFNIVFEKKLSSSICITKNALYILLSTVGLIMFPVVSLPILVAAFVTSNEELKSTRGKVDRFQSFLLQQYRKNRNVELAIITKSQFLLSLAFEYFMLDYFINDNSKDLFTMEKTLLQWIKDEKKWSYKAYEKGLHSDCPELKAFLKDFCFHTSALRKAVLDCRAFHIAIVGQPGAGKSTLCSRNLFLKKIQYKKETKLPNLHRCSEKITVIDFPGMLGTDDYSGASMKTLQASLKTFDVIIIVLKARERSYDIQEFCSISCTTPLYVCITHADDMIEKYMAEQDDKNEEDESNNEEDEIEKRWYDNAIEDLERWRYELCNRCQISQEVAHFVLPSSNIIKRARNKTNQCLKIGNNDKDSIKDVGHLAKWLHGYGEQLGVDAGHLRKHIPGPSNTPKSRS